MQGKWDGVVTWTQVAKEVVQYIPAESEPQVVAVTVQKWPDRWTFCREWVLAWTAGGNLREVQTRLRRYGHVMSLRAISARACYYRTLGYDVRPFPRGRKQVQGVDAVNEALKEAVRKGGGWGTN